MKWKLWHYVKLHSQSVSLLSLSKLKIEIHLHFKVLHIFINKFYDKCSDSVFFSVTKLQFSQNPNFLWEFLSFNKPLSTSIYV